MACTCQGGAHQPLGAALRANDCPLHGEYGQCVKCGRPIEPPRAAWAPTCPDCMAEGCPSSPERALAGKPCDSCDCCPPDLIGSKAPRRIRLSRTARWRLADASLALNGLPARRITRPGPYSNPFKIGSWARLGDPAPQGAIRLSYLISLQGEKPGFTLISDQEMAVDFYRRWAAGWTLEKIARFRDELGGHNLACWCREGTPCHADVLLPLVNP